MLELLVLVTMLGLLLVFSFLFQGTRTWNSGLDACKANTSQLELYLHAKVTLETKNEIRT